MPTAKLGPPTSLSAMGFLTHARLPCVHRHRLRLSDACPGSRLQRLTQFHSEPRPDATEVSFGPFRWLPTQFLLLERDKPVSLGSRALEILTVLLERPGELVSKQELMARVWPNVFVEPANLT